MRKYEKREKLVFLILYIFCDFFPILPAHENNLLNFLHSYVDDKLVNTVSASLFPGGATDSTPHYIILNTQVGGTWGGDPDGTTVWPQYHCILFQTACVRACVLPS
jgi:hypothetical protein